jgi:ATP-binding cassette, subfamily B, bacterial
MMGGQMPMRLRLGDSVTRQQVKPGTFKRILPYAKRYRWQLLLLLIATAIDAVIAVANPLILGMIIDNGILPRRSAVVIALSAAVVGLGAVDVLALYTQAKCSARIGQELIFWLRTEVFEHVQRQSLAFFARSQTGSLVSRLNTDVVGAQQAVTSLLSQTVSTVLTLIFVLIAMFYLSWQISIASLLLIPCFIFSGKLIGKRLQRLAREQMQLDAELGSLMNERFSVDGATLCKLYGRPHEESGLFAVKAGRVRDVSMMTSVYSRLLLIALTLLIALVYALVFGLGGILVIHRTFKIGTLVAMVTLITRLYGPVNQLSSMQINVLTALVSFDRVFEVLDLKPLITELPGASALPAQPSGAQMAPQIEFDHVWFRYPAASEVSLASLESVALRMPERSGDSWTLSDVSFRAPSGRLTALVGPSGAGKTTITSLVPRLYDPGSGTVRIGGRDVREISLRSLREAVGVVTQEAHLLHETIRANLTYARPDATERDLVEACQAARIWDLISSLPNGLDTVAGDRGYRFSGGERQRVALARLLLKAPAVVVLDEATAHLDSESEAAIQQAMKTALAGRTSLVIAHRLSTIREADQILVVDEGQIRERGRHAELLAADGLYAELYRTQFSRQSVSSDGDSLGTPPARTAAAARYARTYPRADGSQPQGASLAPRFSWFEKSPSSG